MKYPKLIGVCKDCLGCQRLENEKFIGVYKCKWNEKVEWKQEAINQCMEYGIHTKKSFNLE